jgi:hypothetical protein
MNMCAWAASTDSLTTIVDLEVKITQKVKGILMPIDPDAIVMAKVDIKKVNTELLGTQMTAVGIFATGDVQKIEDADIESINVTIMSAMEKFPTEISKLIETSVIGLTKKGKVQFVKMEASTIEALQKQKEYRKVQAEGFQKLGQQADQLYKMIGLAAALLVLGFATTQILLSFLQRKFQSKAINTLADKIASIKPADSGESTKSMMVEASGALPGAAASSSGKEGAVELSGKSEDDVLEMMSVASLQALLADAYWCEKDAYASWAWTRLSPNKKIELINSWSAFKEYANYLNQVDPVKDRFHRDPHYLNPQIYHHLSNERLLEWVKDHKSCWSELSLMRRQSLPLSLEERVGFAKTASLESSEVQWDSNPSELRHLPARLEISALSLQDEELLMKNPEMLPPSMRMQLPSMIWLALIPKEECEKILQKIPAQNLAEVLTGPEEALAKIKNALPEKKRLLLEDYSKKIRVNRNSPWLKSLSTSALEIFNKNSLTTAKDSSARKAA